MGASNSSKTLKQQQQHDKTRQDETRQDETKQHKQTHDTHTNTRTHSRAQRTHTQAKPHRKERKHARTYTHTLRPTSLPSRPACSQCLQTKEQSQSDQARGRTRWGVESGAKSPYLFLWTLRPAAKVDVLLVAGKIRNTYVPNHMPPP